jgi:ribosomal protein S18 acetylase RimI-like enzyme
MRQRLVTIAGDEGYETLVAVDDGHVVGFVGTRVGRLYEDDGQYGHVMALAVAGRRQRNGIGRMLMTAAESSLAKRGARVLVVTSVNQRADAHAFYEHCGYTFTGRRYKKSAVLSA